MAERKSTKVSCVCAICTAPFSIYPADIRKGGGHCCSVLCRNRRLAARSRRDLVETFWANVEKTDGCWLWTGNLNRDGYGQINRNHTTVRAHRLSWEIHRGLIPDGLRVLHNCPGGDNPGCVNPAHLFLGTDADNTADMVAKGRQSRGERQGAAKLTDAAVRAMRAEYATGTTTLNALANKYGIHLQNVFQIIKRKAWKHV